MAPRVVIVLLLGCLAVPMIRADPSALIAVGDSWRYQAVNGTSSGSGTGSDNAGDSWKNPEFDDSAWRLGPSGFSAGYGLLTDPTPLEGGFGTIPTHRFRCRFELADPTQVALLTLRIDYDDAFVAYLNGVEVARRNLPGLAGEAVSPATPALAWRYRAGADELDLTHAVPLLRTGANVLALQVHGTSGFDSTLSCAAELLANCNRGPMLQSTSTRATWIAWRTPVAVPSVLEWGIDDALDRRVMVDTPTTNHLVRLDGLDPATTYSYRVRVAGATTEGATRPQQFRTLAESGAIRFAVLGDSGGGGVRQREIARWLGASSPDLVLHTGDTVYPGFQTDLADQRFLSVYRPWMARVPLFQTAGNHDLLSGVDTYYDQFFLPTNSATGTEHYYSFDHGEVHFTVLFQTWFIQNQIREGDLQYQWLTNDLAKTAKPWKILVLHHPLLTSGLHRGDDYGGNGPLLPNGIPDRIDILQVLLPVASRFGVQLVLSGHDHNFERFVPVEGVCQIVTGGGGGGLYYLSQLDWYSSQFHVRHHFVRASVTRDEASFEAVDYQGQVFDSFKLRRTPATNPDLRAAWSSPVIESTPANDGRGNLAGQIFDFAGTGVQSVAGRWSNIGQLVVNQDRTHLYLGLRDVMLNPDWCVLLFVEVPGMSGVESLAAIGNGLWDPEGEGVEILDGLPGLEFDGFRPAVVCVVGDEYGDATQRGFVLGGAQVVGQGVFGLTPGLPEIPGTRLQQFDRSPQLPSGSGGRGSDFVEIAIPWSQIGGLPAAGGLRVAAVAARGLVGVPPPPAPLTLLDTGFIGTALTADSRGSARLASFAVELAEDPDPDRDDLLTADELRLGTDPRRADSDGDGLPDGWEVRNGFSPLSAAGVDAGDADADGDGASNWAEWIAGTSPRDGASLFVLESSLVEGGRIRLRWPRVAGRRYTLERAESLLGGFHVVLGLAQSQGEFLVYEEAAAEGGSDNRFYRIAVAIE